MEAAGVEHNGSTSLSNGRRARCDHNSLHDRELSTISDASGVLRIPLNSSRLVELMGRRRERCPDSEREIPDRQAVSFEDPQHLDVTQTNPYSEELARMFSGERCRRVPPVRPQHRADQHGIR